MVKWSVEVSSVEFEANVAMSWVGGPRVSSGLVDLIANPQPLFSFGSGLFQSYLSPSGLFFPPAVCMSPNRAIYNFETWAS